MHEQIGSAACSNTVSEQENMIALKSRAHAVEEKWEEFKIWQQKAEPGRWKLEINLRQAEM